MYISKREPLSGGYRYIIRPNRSLSWRGLRLYFFIALSVSLIIAFSFLLLGAWLVMPFSGMEMLLLYLALRYVSKRDSKDFEWITIGGGNVEIVHFTGRKKETCSFPIHWVQIKLLEQDRWYNRHVMIGSHGRFVEVASCLGDEEKQKLYHELQLSLQQ